MSSNAADRQHTVEQYERTLRRISQAINAINIIRYENMDKPELEGIANPALNQLTQLDLVFCFEKNSPCMSNHPLGSRERW